MTADDIIEEVCSREIAVQCDRFVIDDIPIYYYVRRSLFEKYFEQNGFAFKYSSPQTSRTEKRRSYVISFFQILWLLLTKYNITTFVYSFYRTDKINGLYVDKFTDPLIDFSNLGKSFIVFENGRQGHHNKPRIHSDKIINADSINKICSIYAKYGRDRYYLKNKEVFDSLFGAIDQLFPGLNYNTNSIVNIVLKKRAITNTYRHIFKRLGIKAFIAPSRNDFQHIIPAAKQCSIPVYELQHGFVKGMSITYSGQRNPVFTPDFFLAYGNLSVTDNYGIDTNKIRVIGWAFDYYISGMINEVDKKDSNSVLIVGDPMDVEKQINVCIKLAKEYPQIDFYYRGHPGCVVSSDSLIGLSGVKNIIIDDNSQNILVTLNHFSQVVGISSTVLCEASSKGKKVGMLYIDGLHPISLNGHENEYFWEIRDVESFGLFLHASSNEKKRMDIYSEFNRSLFEELVLPQN